MKSFILFAAAYSVALAAQATIDGVKSEDPLQLAEENAFNGVARVEHNLEAIEEEQAREVVKPSTDVEEAEEGHRRPHHGGPGGRPHRGGPHHRFGHLRNGTFNGTHPWRHHANGTFNGTHPWRHHANGTFNGTHPWRHHAFNGTKPWKRNFNGTKPWKRDFNGTKPWKHHANGTANNMFWRGKGYGGAFGGMGGDANTTMPWKQRANSTKPWWKKDRKDGKGGKPWGRRGPHKGESDDSEDARPESEGAGVANNMLWRGKGYGGLFGAMGGAAEGAADESGEKQMQRPWKKHGKRGGRGRGPHKSDSASDTESESDSESVEEVDAAEAKLVATRQVLLAKPVTAEAEDEVPVKAPVAAATPSLWSRIKSTFSSGVKVVKNLFGNIFSKVSSWFSNKKSQASSSTKDTAARLRSGAVAQDKPQSNLVASNIAIIGDEHVGTHEDVNAVVDAEEGDEDEDEMPIVHDGEDADSEDGEDEEGEEHKGRHHGRGKRGRGGRHHGKRGKRGGRGGRHGMMGRGGRGGRGEHPKRHHGKHGSDSDSDSKSGSKSGSNSDSHSHSHSHSGGHAEDHKMGLEDDGAVGVDARLMGAAHEEEHRGGRHGKFGRHGRHHRGVCVMSVVGAVIFCAIVAAVAFCCIRGYTQCRRRRAAHRAAAAAAAQKAAGLAMPAATYVYTVPPKVLETDQNE